jgi:hypothetical protein
MYRKLLKFYIKGKLLTKSVDNFVDNKKKERYFYYKCSVFVVLDVF